MPSQSRFEWIGKDVVLAIHEAQIAEHGGALGIRDTSLLESALARPQNAASYSRAEVPELAALYALGIIKNHPFVDGNKRVGAVLLETFLMLHGYELTTQDAALLQTVTALAAGEIDQESFKTWVHANARKSPGDGI